MIQLKSIYLYLMYVYVYVTRVQCIILHGSENKSCGEYISEPYTYTLFLDFVW